MNQLRTFVIFVCLQVATCRELGDLKSEPTGVDARGEIRSHLVPSTPLTPEEIKDAFHEPAVVMEEVKRLQNLGLTDAVQAVVEGTAKLSAGHKATSQIVDHHAESFSLAMRGYTFLEIGDSQRPENARYRKALFVAACASLSAEARARAASTDSSGA